MGIKLYPFDDNKMDYNVTIDRDFSKLNAITWCDKNIGESGHYWRIVRVTDSMEGSFVTFAFREEKDATLFALRWV